MEADLQRLGNNTIATYVCDSVPWQRPTFLGSGEDIVSLGGSGKRKAKKKNKKNKVCHSQPGMISNSSLSRSL